MNVIGLINLFGLAACCTGMIIVIRKGIPKRFTVFIMGLLIWISLHSLSNTLEWLGLTSILDPYEDFLQILSPVIWGSFLYIFFLQSEVERRKQTEARLAESQERLSLAVEGARIGLWDWHVQTGEVFFSEEWATMVGYTLEELDPISIETWTNLTHPEDLKRAQLLLQEHFDFITDAYECELRVRHKNGDWFWIIDRGKVFDRDESGAPVRMSGVHYDINQRKLAEENLKASEDKFSKLFQLSPDAIALASAEDNGTLLDVNKAFLELCDSKKPSLLGHKMGDLDIFHGSGLQELLHNTLFEEQASLTQEISIHCSHNKTIPCSLACQMLNIEGKPCMLVVLRNISEFIHMQRMMVETEKMISLGGISAGIAHEINNPLGIIMLASQNMVRRSRPDIASNRKIAESMGLDIELLDRYMKERKLDTFLNNIIQATTRATDIVQNMLNFSRRSDSQYQLCDIATIIDSAVALAGNDYDLKKRYDIKSINIEIQVESPSPTLLCVQTEIEQVLLNLLRNAAQAMNNAAPPTESPRIDIQAGTTPQDMVRIIVRDNGPGIPKDVLKRILEPFFTTKPSGEGTGLGLSVSYFIITQGHGGTFHVHSRVGHGTSFTIELPRQSPTAAPSDKKHVSH